MSHSSFVFNLYCKTCNALLCRRGQSVSLIADPTVHLYSTDLMNKNVSEDESKTIDSLPCRCVAHPTRCARCKQGVIGYHVVRPCEPCLRGCNNGHYWLVHDAISQVRRLHSSKDDAECRKFAAEVARMEHTLDDVGPDDADHAAEEAAAAQFMAFERDNPRAAHHFLNMGLNLADFEGPSRSSAFKKGVPPSTQDTSASTVGHEQHATLDDVEEVLGPPKPNQNDDQDGNTRCPHALCWDDLPCLDEEKEAQIIVPVGGTQWALPDLTCAVCFNLMVSPKMFRCGHTFCGDCALREFDLRKSCPCCKQRAACSPSPNFSLESVINSLPVHCVHGCVLDQRSKEWRAASQAAEGAERSEFCSAVVPLGSLQQHIVGCPFSHKGKRAEGRSHSEGADS